MSCKIKVRRKQQQGNQKNADECIQSLILIDSLLVDNDVGYIGVNLWIRIKAVDNHC